MSCSTLRSTTPYVVMVGDVGIGKSTIAEKLTGRKKLSSNNKLSFTKIPMNFTSRTRRLDVCDTPGSNPMQERYEHNQGIAQVRNKMDGGNNYFCIKESKSMNHCFMCRWPWKSTQVIIFQSKSVLLHRSTLKLKKYGPQDFFLSSQLRGAAV